MELQIAVDPRAASGKANKALRRTGLVPGVLFGKEHGSQAIQLDEKAFEELYRKAGRTNIVGVSVAGGQPTNAIIKSVQRHPLSGRPIHVDFFAFNVREEMQADVRLVFLGTAPAVENLEGTLFTQLDHLKVRALPTDLPHELTVDVSGLVDFEASVHVRDIAAPAGVTVLNDPDELVARVSPPRREEEVVAPVEAEGAEAAEVPGEEAAPTEADEDSSPS